MSLLSLEHVSKRDPYAPEKAVLANVSLELDERQLTVVWGLRRSGRSTLLRVAAGIERPDVGSVRFAGRDLGREGERLLGGQIGYCQRMLPGGEGRTALEHAMVGPLARWASTAKARELASAALERVGASECAQMREHELSNAESVRVALARTLALEPRLIVIDEPVKGVELTDRDGVLALLRRLADEGVTVLTSTGESTGLSGADQALVLGGGELRGAPAPELAPVLPLRRTGTRQASA